jgi:hypothetical protein
MCTSIANPPGLDLGYKIKQHFIGKIGVIEPKIISLKLHRHYFS